MRRCVDAGLEETFELLKFSDEEDEDEEENEDDKKEECGYGETLELLNS